MDNFFSLNNLDLAIQNPESFTATGETSVLQDPETPHSQSDDDTESMIVEEVDAATVNGILDENIKSMRIVDFLKFWEELKKLDGHCLGLGCRLSNLRIIKEVKYGFSSKFEILCINCNKKLFICTNELPKKMYVILTIS